MAEGFSRMAFHPDFEQEILAHMAREENHEGEMRPHDQLGAYFRCAVECHFCDVMWRNS